MNYIIQAKNLTKIYKGKEVVSDVNLHVKKGEIYGLLGPNGAGKTTIMRMILNLVKPTNGEILLFDQKLTPTSYELFKRIGNIIEYPIFFDKLTARENLNLHCEYIGYYDKSAIDTTLAMVQLQNFEEKQVKDFSLGMKQRLGIARAILSKPELLILDEPLNGLDPVGIKEMRSLFKILKEDYGMTILISSHNLAEIEKIADTIAIIKDGHLINEILMDDIRSENVGYIELETDDIKKSVFVIHEILKIANFKIMDTQTIRIYDSKIAEGEISKALIMNDVLVTKINKKEHSLEDYFLKIINGGGAIA
ncbi:ATP-binding cassette domain-containing protein [uncultured Rummeliibacillus sp.]|uniref:ATP-binding cassette domain-containing protein n=1 Tax=uncultured Rummeliibacillus sp. TaxID=762292 RepID=UPI00260ADE2E|nr:ATP-binding cassette domain-containing protein [uncultured Rummeliibacillus sp.]